ncbi:hypothetical protein [Rubrobacter naiadicus]
MTGDIEEAVLEMYLSYGSR